MGHYKGLDSTTRIETPDWGGGGGKKKNAFFFPMKIF